MKKRLGIFCTYDPDGIIDDYIIYLLQDIKKILSHLSIVCNGKLTPEGRRRLETITEDILVRENTGFDMEAWRQGLLRKKNNFAEYDELILFNDSFYGPFYTFEEVLDEMDSREPDIDFWGITIHGEGADPENLCPYGYVPEHIQSYFLVVRSRMFHSPEFLSYWENAEVAQTFSEAIKKHEVCFTKYFFDKGFSYSAYCDTRQLEKEYSVKFNPYIFLTQRILKEQRCPIIKKRVFYLARKNYLEEAYGTNPLESLKFVRDNTNYDESLIIKNLLRKLNIAAIKSSLGLDYILPTDISIGGTVNLNEAVIVAHLYYEDLMPECVKYLCNAPKEILLVVTVNDEKKKSIVEQLFKTSGRKCEVRVVEPRGRDMAALYVGAADLFHRFKYLCFIHDKKSLRAGEPITNGEEFFNLLWKNFLTSENFIRNTLLTLENNPHLGVLAPPAPYHGRYAPVFFMDKFWSKVHPVYNETLNLADKLNIPRSYFDVNFPPLAIGNVFWCRTAAVKRILDKNWTIKDFPKEPIPIDGTISHSLERILPFAAQAEGFYTGWLMTEDFAKNELENFIHFATDPLFLNLPSPEPAPTAPAPAPITPAIPLNHFIYQHFLNLTTLQVLKFYLQSRFSPRFWGFFRPFKNLLAKLGFRV